MRRTAALWKQFDKVFAEANKLWEQADQLFAHADHPMEPEHDITAENHNVRFVAKSFSGRLRIATYFLRLSAKVLWLGHTTLRFKRTKPNTQN